MEANLQNTIVRHKSGSHSYGMATPESDLDIRGIFCGEPIQVRTPFFRIKEQKILGEEDTVYYEVANYFKLATENNPNVLETLWVDKKDVLKTSRAYELMRKNRHLFMCSKLAFTTTGYASAQCKKMRSREKWLNNPQPLESPQPKDFLKVIQYFGKEKKLKVDLEEYRENHKLIHYGNDAFGVYKCDDDCKLWNNKGTLCMDDHDPNHGEEIPVLIVKFCRKQYDQKKTDHENYWNWKNSRNKVRSELEAKHGFDCYSSDTEFLTENGWKLFDEIKNEKLATFNSEHQIEYQKPIERIDNVYTGNMYHFSGQHQDTLVTANHRMYVKDWSRVINQDMSNWKFSEACLVKKDHKVLRVISPKKNIQNLPKGCYTGNLELKDYLKIMGWYVSDGSMQFRGDKPKAIQISQSKKGSILTKNISKLKNKKATNCFHGIYEREGKLPENRWIFSEKEVVNSIYNDCGHGSKEKRLPSWVFLLTKRLMTFLLKAAIDGDGTEREKDVYTYYSSNKGLAGDIQRLALCSGYETSLWGPYSNKSCESRFGDSDMYQVHINMSPDSNEDTNSSKNVKKISVEKERVVCFSVKNETLITRRNGKISLHGNCKHAMHCVRLMRIGEECLRDGVYNVARSDAEELLAIRNGAWSYEEILKYAKDMDEKIRGKLYKETFLPKKPDMKALGELLMEVQDMYWKKSWYSKVKDWLLA